MRSHPRAGSAHRCQRHRRLSPLQPPQLGSHPRRHEQIQPMRAVIICPTNAARRNARATAPAR